MSSPPFDLIIIGAGINGAGIARDAAMRGLKVLLLDKGDIGSGTSSWSTRLIHGGLRYLEHGEFGLVRESLRERETLLKIAPHLVKPLPLLIPIYDRSRRGPWTMRTGMIAYDVLSLGKNLPHHHMLSRAEALERAPGLNPEGLVGAALYYDGQVEFVERLVLENVLSARDHEAVVVTYAQVEKFIMSDGVCSGVQFRSELDGQQSTAHASLLINAAGPWVDRVLSTLSPEGNVESRLIGGTKGSHIVVAPFTGAPASALYIEADTDQRPFFIIPWNNHYLIGTTDLPYQGDLDHVAIDQNEIYYLLRETNGVIPSANLTRAKILYTYSGVRPLPQTGEKEAKSITRRHFIRQHARCKNLFSIVGGKITTYRSLAEETVDLVCQRLGRSRQKCTTDEVALPGAAVPDFPAFSKEFERTSGLPEATSRRMLRIYGTRASLITELIEGNASLAGVFDTETGAIGAEIVFVFRHELAKTLADCLMRRTMVGLNSSLGVNAIEAVANVAQGYLGWSDERIRNEVKAYHDFIERLRPS
ncbi:MAG: glycerol-3-phosphate dehydrogenase [bacterium]